MKKVIINLIFFILICNPQFILGQSFSSILFAKMEDYEIDIQNTYNEYQKVYYEKKSSKNELLAFENIISVYVSQILEIYETLSLSKSISLEKPKDIAARSLIFRSLTYLEKAPLNPEFYEQACYDYYRALEIDDTPNKIPVTLKILSNPIKVGNNVFNRLIDLLEIKGLELYSFGKVEVSLKNFKITSNLDANSFEIVRFNCSPDKQKYTYTKAVKLLKDAFKDINSTKGESKFFLALPEGSYFIHSTAESNPLYSYLSAIYVRANQQQRYIIEPLVNWIIIYENPYLKQPNFFDEEFLIQSYNNDIVNGNGKGNGNGSGKNKKITLKEIKKMDDYELLNNIIAEYVNESLEKVDVSKIFNLRDPWIRSRFSVHTSKVIVTYLLSGIYYNSWSNWILSWEISTSITNEFSPGKSAPTELVQLVNNVLSKISHN